MKKVNIDIFMIEMKEKDKKIVKIKEKRIIIKLIHEIF